MGKFDTNIGAPISKEKAKEKADKWKNNKEKRKDIKTEANFFGREWIEKLLAKEGCTGIWINYGETKEGKSMQPFLIAGDIDGNYILTNEAARTAESDDIINSSGECPPDCPPNKGEL
jgi:hypothetical protein